MRAGYSPGFVKAYLVWILRCAQDDNSISFYVRKSGAEGAYRLPPSPCGKLDQ